MTTPSAEAITKASKSNLALAFIALPREKREAMTCFYAFCRVIDDIADEPGPSVEEKQRQLDLWKEALSHPTEGEPALAASVRDLLARYQIKESWLVEIIRGCEMDLQPVRYATFEDLRLYCYRVASVVGLVSIEIFGYKNQATRRYAVELGYALQLTNIIRDVAKDLANDGRIYLPLEDLERFGIDPDRLAESASRPEFLAMMRFQAQRAKAYYARAVAERPPEDRRSLAAAEIMRRVYDGLLRKMDGDDFRVFDRFYRLSKPRKIAMILRVLVLG